MNNHFLFSRESIQRLSDSNGLKFSFILNLVANILCDSINKFRRVSCDIVFFKKDSTLSSDNFKCFDLLLKSGEQVTSLSRSEISYATRMIIRKIDEELYKTCHDYFIDLYDCLVFGSFQGIFKGLFFFNVDSYDAEIIPCHTIPREKFLKGVKYAMLVKSVKKNIIMGRFKPIIIADRNSSLFVKRLLFYYVSDVKNGIIDIISIYRDPGVKSLVFIKINNTGIPINYMSKLNIKNEIRNVSAELRGEKIEYIYEDESIDDYLERLLNYKSKIFLLTDKEPNVYFLVVFNKKDVKMVLGRDNSNFSLLCKAFKLNIPFINVLNEEEYPFLYLLNFVFRDSKIIKKIINVYKNIDELMDDSLFNMSSLEKNYVYDIVSSFLLYYSDGKVHFSSDIKKFIDININLSLRIILKNFEIVV